VNGKTFAATTNLVAALQAIAVSFKGKVLIWADAICINQNDPAERSA